MARKSGDLPSPRAAVRVTPELAAPLLEPSDENVDVAIDESTKPWVKEVRGLAHLAGPLVLQNLAGYLLSVVSAAFLGHLNDPVALSSAVLAGSFYNITGYSLVIGLSAGMETVCGQAFGAGNDAMLGLVLQRALLICWAACVPISVFWSQSHWVLTALHQKQEIVDGASRYLIIATPALFLSSVSSCLYRYLVTQQDVRPPVICTIITAAVCPAFNWFLIYRLRWGLDGAAWAFVASTATYTVLLTAYAVVRDWLKLRRGASRQTWAGFSWRALEGWGPYLRLALPAAAMICMEWWIFEMVIFMAGLLGDFADVAVAVMGISFHITSWTYMIPMSLGTAVNTRVSNALGSGSASRAQRCAHAGVVCTLCLQLVMAMLLFAGRHLVASAFTTEHEIVYNVGRIMPVLAVGVVGDGMVAVLGGVMRGSGRQSLGALLNLVGYWGVGCPLAVALGFGARWDVLGFWCGLATATLLQAVILSSVVFRFDWDSEVARAAKLVSQHAPQQPQYTQQPSPEGSYQQQHQQSQSVASPRALPLPGAGAVVPGGFGAGADALQGRTSSASSAAAAGCDTV